MILVQRYTPSTGKIEQIDPEHVGPLLPQEDLVLWVDLQHPTDDELHWLSDTFHFHPLAMEDVRKQRQRSKLEWYEGYYFIVLHAIKFHKRSGRLDSDEIDTFLGKNYLVTVHRNSAPIIAQVRQRWNESACPREETSFLFYLLLDAVVDDYFPALDDIGDIIDTIDTTISTKPDPAMLNRIFSLRHTLLSIRKIVTPLRDALNELIRSEESGHLFPLTKTTAYFNDVFDHALRVIDFVDTYRDMLSSSVEAYQSSLSNRLNENMQRLTVVATILATNAAITGFFGVNLRGMGVGSEWPYGAQILFLTIIVVTLFELWIFRRKGWF